MIVLSHCVYCDESTYVDKENTQDCCCDECFKLLRHKHRSEASLRSIAPKHRSEASLRQA